MLDALFVLVVGPAILYASVGPQFPPPPSHLDILLPALFLGKAPHIKGFVTVRPSEADKLHLCH